MKKKRQVINVPWTPFIKVFEEDEVSDEKPEMCLKNSMYVVFLRGIEHPVFGTVTNLVIRRIDRTPITDRDHLARIKNELVGPDYEAIEIFGSQDEPADEMYRHLFALMDFRTQLTRVEKFRFDETKAPKNTLEERVQEILKGIDFKVLRERLSRGLLPSGRELKQLRRFLLDEVKRYYGLPPHTSTDNPDFMSPEYAERFKQRFGMPIEHAATHFNISTKTGE